MKDQHIQAKLDAIRIIVEQRGGKVLCTFTQRRGISRSRKSGGAKKLNLPLHSKSYISKGKAKELCQLVEKHSADVIIFLNNLNPRQRRYWQELTDCTILTVYTY